MAILFHVRYGYQCTSLYISFGVKQTSEYFAFAPEAISSDGFDIKDGVLFCFVCVHLLLLLRPWLIPSSGVAGIADDLIAPCCPVCCVAIFEPRLCHISLTRIFPS